MDCQGSELKYLETLAGDRTGWCKSGNTGVLKRYTAIGPTGSLMNMMVIRHCRRFEYGNAYGGDG